MWAGQESVLSLDGGAFTLILWTVKLVLGDLAPAVIYGLVTVIHAERIAPPLAPLKKGETRRNGSKVPLMKEHLGRSNPLPTGNS